MKVLDTKIALDPSHSPVSIVQLAVQFLHVIPHIQLNELDDQQRTFRASTKNLVVSTKCVPDFWYTLGSVIVKDGLGNSKFPLLSVIIFHDNHENLTSFFHKCRENIFSNKPNENKINYR